MKLLKKSILTLALITLTATALAQGPRGGGRGGRGGRGSEQREQVTPEQSARKMTNRMADSLNLSDGQKDKVYQLNLEFAKKQDEMRESMRTQTSEDRQAKMEEMRTEMEELNKERTAALSMVLTPEQQKAYAKMMEESKKKQEERKENRDERKRE